MAAPLPVWPSLVPLSASALRRELNARALHRATRLGLRHELTTGRSPSVIFGANDLGDVSNHSHGNFHPESYQAILERSEWARRLNKAHTASRRAMPRAEWQWRELDCAGSSDALLMNIFCHPATFRDRRVAALLGGVVAEQAPRFGIRLGVPLANRVAEMTEVDMQLEGVAGPLLVEAKLTESNFQTARPALVLRFRDLETVFDVDQLPRTRVAALAEEWDEASGGMVGIKRGHAGHYVSYQLIRGTLAAHALGGSFCVLCDARRQDLVEQWLRIQQAVRYADLRCRLELLTWQELAATLPDTLQVFLASKYGILPA